MSKKKLLPFTSIDVFFMVVLGAWFSINNIPVLPSLSSNTLCVDNALSFNEASMLTRLVFVNSSLFFVLWRCNKRAKLEECEIKTMSVHPCGIWLYKVSGFVCLCYTIVGILLLLVERSESHLVGWLMLFAFWWLFDTLFPKTEIEGDS